MDSERRLLFRQGALILFVSALLGIVTAVPVPHPGKWMAAHVGGLLTGILIIAFGALWLDVRLAESTRKLALRMGLIAAWMGLVGNVYAALVNLPGPATEPGRLPDAPWHLPVFFVILAVVVPCTLGSFFLVWKGLSAKT
jgi:hypothetical protein